MGKSVDDKKRSGVLGNLFISGNALVRWPSEIPTKTVPKSLVLEDLGLMFLEIVDRLTGIEEKLELLLEKE